MCEDGMESLEQAFGELRSLVHRGEDVPAQEWCAFLSSHRDVHPERYDQVWLPYLTRVELPTFKVASIERCHELLGCLPQGIKLRFTATMQPDDVTSFLDSPDIEKIVELDLSRAALGDPGLSILARSPLCDRLRALDLRLNDLGANGIAAFVEERSYASLERLVLCDNNLDNLAASLIAESLIAPELAWLDLSRNNIGPVGQEYLRGSARLENVFLIS